MPVFLMGHPVILLPLVHKKGLNASLLLFLPPLLLSIQSEPPLVGHPTPTVISHTYHRAYYIYMYV